MQTIIDAKVVEASEVLGTVVSIDDVSRTKMNHDQNPSQVKINNKDALVDPHNGEP